MPQSERKSAIMPLTSSLRLRAGLPSDRGIILATWLPGLYHGNGMFKKIPKQLFEQRYSRVLEALLDSSPQMILCAADDPDVIVGYAVVSLPRLHWIYIKKAWRGLGLARQLLPEGIETVSHLTRVGEKLMPKEWTFDPFL